AAKAGHIARALLLASRLRRRYRTRGPGMNAFLYGCAGEKIVYTSRRFQPCAETFGADFHFIGPSMAPRPEAPMDWAWVEGRPLLYVSLGTVFNNDLQFFRHCFEAFAETGYAVLLSVGSEEAAAALGPAPPNFQVRSRVPQL